MGEPEKEAIYLMARYEGILLDPVYTGRAMAGLVDHELSQGLLQLGECRTGTVEILAFDDLDEMRCG